MSSSTAGIIAIGAAGGALVALIICALIGLRLRRLRAAQSVVVGSAGRDLIEHGAELEQRLVTLAEEVHTLIARLEQRDAELGSRLKGAIAHVAVVRYDAMGEMTGRQSSSVAMLDSHRSGVVLSSILHREQARLYAKPILDGRSEFDLSPEEQQALHAAIAPAQD